MVTQKKIGVVLFNLGGPDSLDAVEPFLFNLFNDPDIINFPFSFLFRKRLAKYISRKRSPKIVEQYKQIGGKSPLLELTRKQAEALNIKLNSKINCKVYIAMRYWHPFTDEIMPQLEKERFNKLILLPLYPQYSVSTIGSSKNEWDRIKNKYSSIKNIETVLVSEYFNHPTYIDAIVEGINFTLKKFPEDVRDSVVLLFSAHGTPIKLVKMGDPYKGQIEETVRSVISRGDFKQKHMLGFQSKVGPQKWLEPKTLDIIDEIAKDSNQNILVIPIAFVSDHLETLFEIGIEFRKHAENKGIKQFEVMPGLNDSPLFIKALSEIVLNNLN